ncbi:MAG: flagellar biosynthesis protein FlhA [Pseudochelatococcus sp.]|jgi:flagellar biosynthesis protein FlhA|uniref:flagellar biosynthesis protein FlhA n=1 Tax=Pseudochelatococcus sp. TaxID=2020869 RepID=UPI003D8FE67F
MADLFVGSLNATQGNKGRDVTFAIGIVAILLILFLPIPPFLIDIGLALSIALSVLILMVALWIQKPLEFSAFPTVLLIATILRLALSIATTRLILADGDKGVTAAGYIIHGFSQFVMSGDFVIGLVVFAILITVNFLVITKGATRIAEVGARFTLDAIPGKQMAIDADLSAGMIDDKEAQRRRRELEEESAFFGSMDGASKFVRGEAVASLIITAVNIFGGIVIGVTRHGMPLSQAADIYTKLTVGDGLVSQIPALIVSLAAGLLVSKGGTQGSAEQAVFGQLSAYPKALFVSAGLMALMGLTPGLPMLPFLALGGMLAFVGYIIPKRRAEQRARDEIELQNKRALEQVDTREAIRETLRTAEIELCMGRQLSVRLKSNQGELMHRVSKMRRKFAQQYGFIVPEIKLTDSLATPPKSYQIKIHGTIVTSHELRLNDFLVIIGDGPRPAIEGDEVREPAFGMRALWINEIYASDAKRLGLAPIDGMSVLLTHLGEIIRNNLPLLLSYKDMRMLFNQLDPEYKRLIDDICPSQISYSGLQAVLKLLLAERVSIRNLNLILEAIAEIVPHVRKTEQIVEHVRLRIAQQICGDLSDEGVLRVLRLGNRWDLVFHQSIRRDARGEVLEIDIDPSLVEEFGAEASKAIRRHLGAGKAFVLVAAPDARPYVRMIIERMYPALAVLSHVEIARGTQIESLGAIS